MTSLVVMPEVGEGRQPSVSLEGDLDVSTVDQAEGLIRAELRSNLGPLLINMGKVTFFSAAAVRLVAMLLAEEVEIVLLDAPHQVRKVIRICGLDEHPRLSFHNTAGDQLELDPN